MQKCKIISIKCDKVGDLRTDGEDVMIPDIYQFGAGSHKLFAINTDKFKFSSLTMLFRVSSEVNDVAYNNLLLSVLQRGTKKHRTVGEINKYLDGLYSMTVSARRYSISENHFLGLTCEMLESRFVYDGIDLEKKAIEFAEEFIYEPLTDEDGLFRGDYVESEKVNIINSLKAQKNNAKAYASLRCREYLTEGETGHVPLEELIEKTQSITAESLTEYYKKVTDNCGYVCFYIGNGRDTVAEALSNFFSRHPSDGAFPNEIELGRAALPDRIKVNSEQMPLSQSKLSIGYRTDVIAKDADIYAMQMLCEIFGGGPASKLFMNVREKLGLCYYCSAAYSVYSGVIMVNSGIDHDRAELAEESIDRELQEIARGNISDTELNAAKLSLKFGYSQIADSTASLENFYLGRWLTTPGITVKDVLDGIDGVTKDDVVRAASRIKKGSVFTVKGDGSSDDNDLDAE